MSENRILSLFHREIWNKFPKTRYLCYHIPNEAKRTGYAYMVAMGMIPGIPDYQVNIASKGYKGLFLEFKTEDGKVSDKQKEVHARLREHGFKVEVVRSLDEALKIFTEYVKNTEYE